MPRPGSGLDGKRIKALRELKNLGSQQAFAQRIAVPQSHISDLEKGKLRSTPVFLRVADALNCTTDFLFQRGPFASVRSAEQLRGAAAKMAFDIFELSLGRMDSKTKDRWVNRCRRVVHHSTAPMTPENWRALAEQIDLAVGMDEPGPRAVDVLRQKAG